MFRRLLILCILVLVLLVGGEAMFFFLMRSAQTPAGPVDLVVAFKGDKERIAAVSALVRKDRAKHLLIPGASEKALGKWGRQYDIPSSIKNMPPVLRTMGTFEDALQTARVIRKNEFDSVMLVTSDYHLPRSWMLLKAMTFGDGVKIYSVGVESGKNPSGLRHRAKLTYNEMVKFWGSIFEMTYYKTTGHLLYANTRVARVVLWLKKILLFDVKNERSEKG